MSNKVRKTLDLQKVATDLWILPLSDNQPMTLSATVNAVARGYVIFDDGVAALPTPYAKFELYLIKNADGKTYQMTVKNVGTLTKGDKPNADENLGNIYLMWVSKTANTGIKTAKITTSGGQTATVNISIDAKKDIATIPISDGKTNFMFWDITTIDIQ